MKIPRYVFVTGLVFLFCFQVHSHILAQENLQAIIKKIQPSVVAVITYDEQGNKLRQGSGFFISKNGDVITNIHVLNDSYSAKVKTSDGQEYTVTKILAEDTRGDIIRISADIPANVVHPLILSNSLAKVGDRIIVIGSPFGLEQTVSDGVVSGVRDVPVFGEIIKIISPMSPGSCGSPVSNMKGEIIGVVTFQVVEGQNLNFAIHSERVEKLVPDTSKTFYEWIEEKKNIRIYSESVHDLGFSSLIKEDYESAIYYFNIVVYINPQFAEAYLHLGYCYDVLKLYVEAIEAYSKAIRIKPEYAEAHNNIGIVYGEIGLHQKAIETFKQAVRNDPEYADAHFNMGITYRKLGQSQEEIEAYKQVILINPEHVAAHFNLGVAYLTINDKNSALDEYKILENLDEDLANKLFNLINK